MNEYLKPVNLPNFFILGAGKSGTTTLYLYLQQHPSVFLSAAKEPTFFCEDFQVIKNPVKYFELFDGVKDEKIIGEASHGYMSDPKVARILKALFPECKFIVILRNPADRAFSLYEHMRRCNLEPMDTFEKALEKEKERSQSLDFKNNNTKSFHNFMYFGSGLYGAQLQRYFSLFDKSQFHILTFDQLKNDLDNSLSKIWEFLEILPISVKPDIANPGYSIRSSFIFELSKKKLLQKMGVSKYLTTYNRAPKKLLNPSTKAELMHRYKEDQELLFSLTGIKFE